MPSAVAKAQNAAAVAPVKDAFPAEGSPPKDDWAFWPAWHDWTCKTKYQFLPMDHAAPKTRPSPAIMRGFVGKYSIALTNWAEITLGVLGNELIWSQFTTGGKTPDVAHSLFSIGGNSFKGNGATVTFARCRAGEGSGMGLRLRSFMQLTYPQTHLCSAGIASPIQHSPTCHGPNLPSLRLPLPLVRPFPEKCLVLPLGNLSRR